MPWRFGREFAANELREELFALDERECNVPARLQPGASTGFETHCSEAIIAQEPPGVPCEGGPFERACKLTACFEFSDPRIVVGHFDRRRPLLGRPMLLELKALGFRFLAGVRITALRQEVNAHGTVFGYRYDTLAGHPETGAEWFLLCKQHDRGDVSFRIQASWRPGDFPNWWSRAGFELLGRRYQRAWHRLAHLRMRRLLASSEVLALPPSGRILHEGTPLDLVSVHSVAGRKPPGDVGFERSV